MQNYFFPTQGEISYKSMFGSFKKLKCGTGFVIAARLILCIYLLFHNTF